MSYPVHRMKFYYSMHVAKSVQTSGIADVACVPAGELAHSFETISRRRVYSGLPVPLSTCNFAQLEKVYCFLTLSHIRKEIDLLVEHARNES